MADVPLLCIHKLQRSVNDNVLWSGISLEVYPGEIWFIRGASGVGKTLFLRAVSCLDPLEVCSMFINAYIFMRTPKQLLLSDGHHVAEVLVQQLIAK